MKRSKTYLAFFTILGIIIIPHLSFSQTISVNPFSQKENPFENEISFSSNHFQQTYSQFILPGNDSAQIATTSILPLYAQENPTGYSYLCRLELSLEKQMPVSFWVKLGEQSYGQIKGNVHAQIKLKRF